MEASPIFAKMSDLLAWLIPLAEKFPRAQRFAPAKGLLDAGFILQENLVRAAKVDGALVALREADVALDLLRLRGRLAADLAFLSLRQYEHFCGRVDEIGRLLGGWMRRARGGMAESRGAEIAS
jgi:hypothetical protein